MKKKIPYVTLVTGVLCVLVYILQWISGFADSANGMILFGGYYKPFIMAGEYGRLLSVAFVHANIWHLLINMMSLYAFGRELETGISHMKYLLILFGSVLGSSLFIFATQGNILAVGISGGLYGLMVTYCILIYRAGYLKNPAVRNAVLATMGINLLINFMPNVSWTAHLGGAVCGFFLTEILLPDPRQNKQMQQRYLAAGIVLSLCLGVFSVQNASIPEDQMYLFTDYSVLSEEKKILPASYVQAIAKRLDIIYDTGTILEDSLS
jgi:rhomboid protease GluP